MPKAPIQLLHSRGGFKRNPSSLHYTAPLKKIQVIFALGPNKLLSDDDGLSDGAEVIIYSSDPWERDSDGDGINDYDEAITFQTKPYSDDSDSDGMLDKWEIDNQLNPKEDDASLDVDEDGLTNIQEYQNGTNPNLEDTDNDGLSDSDEIDVTNTNPLDSDSDDDGLVDGEEDDNGTDPNNNDSDGDGIIDGKEMSWNLDIDGDGLISALDDDSDGDTLPDSDEDANKNGILDPGETSPVAIDTDGDAMSDNWEQQYGLDPTEPSDGATDLDNDGLDNAGEFLHGSNPTVQDSDNDGIPDGVEVEHELNPADQNDATADMDNDGLTNIQEYQNQIDMEDNDSDDDGILDGSETDWDLDTDGDGKINALDSDSDNDGLSDGDEILIYFSNPLVEHSDNDTLNDGDEVNIYHTNPILEDTDKDTIWDDEEVVSGTDGYVINPLLRDTDSDGLLDPDEINTHGTDPTKADSDGDGIIDGEEINLNADPLDDDTDDDGLVDGIEVNLGTDLTQSDTDRDGVPDGDDPSPLNQDMDADGLNDGEELIRGYNGWVLSEKGGISHRQFIVPFHEISRSLYSNYRVYLRAKTTEPKLMDLLGITANVLEPVILPESELFFTTEIYRWYSMNYSLPPDSQISLESILEINIAAPEPVVIDKLMVVPEKEEPVYLTTIATDPDTDGDGLLDGQESAHNTYWFEAEHYPMDIEVIDDVGGSNSKVVVNVGAPMFEIPPGYKYPKGNYQVFIRAKRDPKVDPNAQVELDISIGGQQNPYPVIGELTDQYEWHATRAILNLPTQNTIRILGQTFSPPESVYIDKILILPKIYISEEIYIPNIPLDGDDGIRPGWVGFANLIIDLPRNVTDPMDPDTDGDGYRSDDLNLPGSIGYLTDKFEIDLHLNPFDIDTDHDADLFDQNGNKGKDSILDDGVLYPDYGEQPDGRPDYTDNTDPNPLSSDTDDDGLLDPLERKYGTLPNDDDTD